jgi:hypothetical protein
VTAGRAGWRARARRLSLACLALAAGSNSCTPVSPSAWATSPYSLLPGDYTLMVYVPKGDAGKYVICVAKNDVPDTVSIPVTVTAVTSGWRMTPVGDSNLGFVALLEMSGPTTIYGPVLGQARDPSTGVVVTISPPVDAASATQGDAWLLGTMVSRNFAAGSISGSVQFSIGGEARWCTPNSWSVHPR